MTLLGQTDMGQHPLTERISNKLADLQVLGLLRQRHVSETKPHAMVDFSHNDYLGLAHEPALVRALYAGAQQYGVGSRASPLVSGYNQAHFALEQRLCELTGHQACMLFSSGFSANNALMKTLFSNKDTVLADKFVHASVIDGLKDSGSQIRRFLHNDVNSATRLIERNPHTVVVTESVFSMDGDIAPIAELSRLCQQHDCWLIVDDAHGFGVLPSSFVNANNVDIQVVTFGKALGGQGAAILASKNVIDYLVATSREYIYSTALSPANAQLALAAINWQQDHPQLLTQLTANIALFRQVALEHQLEITASMTAIQPIMIGDNHRVLVIAEHLKQQGFLVGAIRSPTVPVGQARLRITLNAQHQASDICALVSAVAQLIQHNDVNDI
ncbi:8-amino-7-oxononanoate synthase [Shewanella vesiculosa]|uniref:aminotransferase class I/II-fold pyridoxal phosphate-dependent enzyme n=1 Tax=Shewanella vesiculosa TaxID=518738 RepID=UPI000F4EA2F6|nr:8-amino-7-oxononanoate synthase [Shewanella vesiculosa]RPA55211.1 8-amino-7-oxononanoate synthase [Shewanella vesiculosa]UJL43250.1 8-amino-7-oxononanoate synthase [Shewanella vesiculosa]